MPGSLRGRLVILIGYRYTLNRSVTRLVSACNDDTS